MLATYVVDQEVMHTVRKACRKVGLALDRHPRSAIPNPAAHRGQFVLMDVPAGEERRFEWCKRLTEDDTDIKTVLLIHQASRSRVLQGFMAKATIILGWPLAEPELSQKLAALLDPDPSPEEGVDPE